MGADSLVRIAQADAKNFRFNDADFKKFRKNRGTAGSDYFKPLVANVSNSARLWYWWPVPLHPTRY